MLGLIGFRGWLYIAAFTALLAIIGHEALRLYDAGKSAEDIKINHQIERSTDAADQAERFVRECYAGGGVPDIRAKQCDRSGTNPR